MFGKLKNKLKEWTKKIAKVEEETEIETKPTEKIEKIEKKPIQKAEKSIKKTKKVSKKKKEKPKELTSKEFEKLPDKKIDEKLKEEIENGKYSEAKKTFNDGMQSYEPDIEKSVKELEEEPKEALKEVPSKEKKESKKSFLKKLTSNKKTISDKEFLEHSEDLEMILLENNVALEVADKILEELKIKIVDKELSKKEIEETITNSLKQIIENVLIEPFDILEEIKEKKEPYVMIFCGINGVGKTTQIAKFANMLKEKKLTSVLAAGDTFRAAAVEQLKEHGKNLDVPVISHDYGSDPASVGFDAIKYAKKNKIDVVLIDTAGRIHTAINLLQEMAKIKRVCKPDRTIFVGESITGNDAVDQVKAFNENIGIDGIFLSKADIDEKGGTALSVGYVTKKPIIYLGTGQEYKDIEKFDKNKFIEKLGL